MDRGAWRATVHGVTKKWTRLGEQHKAKISPKTNLSFLCQFRLIQEIYLEIYYASCFL